MSKTLEIGRAVLRYSKQGLQLDLAAYVTLSSQQDSLELSNLSKDDILDVLNTKEVWVDRGNGLKVTFEVKVDGKPLDVQDQRSLTRLISDAQLWKQLHLCTTVARENHISDSGTSCDSTTNGMVSGCSRIQLHISQSREHTGSQKQEPHRLMTDVPFADCRPSDGVKVLSLTDVRLDLDIKQIGGRRSAQKRGNPPQVIPTKPEAYNDNNCEDFDDLFGLEQTALSTTLFQETSHIDNSRYPTSDYAVTFGRKDDAISLQSFPSPKSAMSLFRKDARGNRPAGVLIDRIAELIDAAFRFTICRNPLKMHPDIRISRRSFDMHLTDISPALWSPGYLSAISSRACFLPVISHSLTHSVYPRSRSLSLKTKIEALCDTEGLFNGGRTSGNGTNPINGGSPEALNKSMQTILWNHIQTELFDKSVARSLKPLLSPGEKAEAMPDLDEIMIGDLNANVEDLSCCWFAEEDIHRLGDDLHEGPTSDSITLWGNGGCSPLGDEGQKFDLWDDVL